MSDWSVTTTAALARGVEPVSEEWRNVARRRLDSLTKPRGSLGRLEDIAAQWIAVRGDRWQVPIRKGVYIFAADHGVTAEGVSAYPSEVTLQMVLNFVCGGAAINVLAKLHNVRLQVIDVGVAGDFGKINGLTHRKVAQGTRNLRREPAMTEDQVRDALLTGIDMAAAAYKAEQTIVAIGEMGIGNTTSASAITSALTHNAAAHVTGRGTGVTDEAYQRKVGVVEAAVAHHFPQSSSTDALEILRCVGGLEIAAMTGMMIEAARLGLMIVLDGFIATSAAAVAATIAPASVGYMVAGHRSEEPGHAILLAHLGLRPLLTLDMRLGEGSGAVLAIPLIEAAVALCSDMATFESASISGASA